MRHAYLKPDFTTTFRVARDFENYFCEHGFRYVGPGFYLSLDTTVLALEYNDGGTVIEAHGYFDSFDKTIFPSLQKMPTRQFCTQHASSTDDVIRRVNDALIARHRVEVPRDEPELNARDE